MIIVKIPRRDIQDYFNDDPFKQLISSTNSCLCEIQLRPITLPLNILWLLYGISNDTS